MLNSILVWKYLTFWFSFFFFNVWVAKTELLSCCSWALGTALPLFQCCGTCDLSSAHAGQGTFIVTLCTQTLHFTPCSFPLKEGKYRNVIPKNIGKSLCEYMESYYSDARSHSSVEMRTTVTRKREFDFTLWQKSWSELTWNYSLFRFEMGIKSSKEMLIWSPSAFLCMGFVKSKYQIPCSSLMLKQFLFGPSIWLSTNKPWKG